MKKIILFIAFALVSLTACYHDDGVNLGNPDDRVLDSSRGSSTTSVVVSNITIPAATISFMASKYPGYRIHEVEFETEHGVTYYKVRLRNGSADVRLLFTLNWVYVGIK